MRRRLGKSYAPAGAFTPLATAVIVLIAAAVTVIPSALFRKDWQVSLMVPGALLGVTLPMIPESAYGCYLTPVSKTRVPQAAR